jgi:hypothetical protein
MPHLKDEVVRNRHIVAWTGGEAESSAICASVGQLRAGGREFLTGSASGRVCRQGPGWQRIFLGRFLGWVAIQKELALV